MTSGKVDINGWPICYEKFGNGCDILLLIPGALGTGESDYKPQLEGPNAFDQRKYTIIAIELPGWGRSRPPARLYGIDVYDRDADIAVKLMDILGYESYSVIGWSEGAKVGVMMAIKSLRIKCLVAISILIRVSKQIKSPIFWIRNTKNWDKDIYDSLYPIYGDDIQLLWDEYLNSWRDFPDCYLTNDLGLIRCPVLFIHGDQDPLHLLEHPQYCVKKIPESQLHVIKNGSHNCHHNFPAEFKRVVEKFFNECDICF